MKRVCLLACCAVLSGCVHPTPGEVKKEPAAVEQKKPASPVLAVKPERPELTAALVEKTIVKGETTKKEILAKLGSPNAVANNTRRSSGETSAKDAAQLPPIDRAVESWNYWTVPPMKELGKSGYVRIFRLTIYFDDKGVALDYQTAENTAELP